MPVRPLDFDFVLMSELSDRPPHSIPRDEQRIELADSAQERRVHWPALIRKGRMTQEEANRHAGIWREIGEDMARAPDGTRKAKVRYWATHAERRASSPVSWEDKVRELRRELAIRRNRYPKQIAQLIHDEADLRVRMERLEAIHWAYFMELRYLVLPATGSLQERLEPVSRMIAEREHWLFAMIEAGDRAVAGITHLGATIVERRLAWYRAGGREELLRRYPDVPVPALDNAA
jgi:hypothetical protein